MIYRSKEPYKSSTIYRVTASATPEFKNLNPFEKLEAARKVVFNFDYPTPDSISSDDFKRFLKICLYLAFGSGGLGRKLLKVLQFNSILKCLKLCLNIT